MMRKRYWDFQYRFFCEKIPACSCINVIKLAVIANQRARWCGNLLLFRGFPRQFANWLGMTFFLNLMALAQAYRGFGSYISHACCRTWGRNGRWGRTCCRNWCKMRAAQEQLQAQALPQARGPYRPAQKELPCKRASLLQEQVQAREQLRAPAVQAVR